MSSAPFEITWEWPALHAFYRLHPHTAMIVDRAVLRFAERGEGDVDHDRREGRPALRAPDLPRALMAPR